MISKIVAIGQELKKLQTLQVRVSCSRVFLRSHHIALDSCTWRFVLCQECQGASLYKSVTSPKRPNDSAVRRQPQKTMETDDASALPMHEVCRVAPTGA